MFAVMAALNAAGYDAGAESASAHPLRQAVRDKLRGADLPSLTALKKFYAAHQRADNGATLRQYISFALSVEGPPTFRPRFRQDQLPPDVLPLAGFADLLTAFYTEAKIEELWNQSQAAHQQAIAAYQEPITNALFQVNAYLRNATSGYLGRRFQVIVDLLGPPDQVQSRSYENDYFLIVTPNVQRTGQPQFQIANQTGEIRHGYLHYLLDPLSTKYSSILSTKQSLEDIAQTAPALEPEYKSDFLLLTTESLIKAVEARLGPVKERDATVAQALREGFILTPYFSEQLGAFEKQPQAMRLFYPDLVGQIDVPKESRRLDRFEFAKERSSRRFKSGPPPPATTLTGAAKTVDEADDLYQAKNYPGAKERYLRALQETSDKKIHAQAYCGLARIATLQNDKDQAEQLFQKTVELNTDPPSTAWARVYLGRLAELRGARSEAVQYYQAVLATADAPPAARRMATQGLQSDAPKSP